MRTLLEIVESKIGTDASPKDNAPDRLGCAETVSTILAEYLIQFGVAFPVITGTNKLEEKIISLKGVFEKVTEPQAEDIVLCATGTNSHPDLVPNGHTGFYLNANDIASNSSLTGNLEQNYTREEWRKLFYYYGGYPIHLYRLKPDYKVNK